ncbi:MAG: hypothetical protein U0R52_10010 [Solirubrobacterales bacterium]
MKRLEPRLVLPAALGGLLVTLAMAWAGGVLAALPLLLLVVPLALGRYPGEETIERLRARRLRRRPLRAIRAKPAKPREARLLRGRLLIAASLAERGPPLAVAS